MLNGAGLEESLEEILKHTDHVIDASTDLELPCGDTHHHEGHHHAHDPHIWLSPELAKEMCKNITVRNCCFDEGLVAVLKHMDNIVFENNTSNGKMSIKLLDCGSIVCDNYFDI